jgi:ACR3 family arsenite efflux pump ArsB
MGGVKGDDLSALEKLETVLILLAIGLGLALGQSATFGGFAGKLIGPLLVAMIFGVFLKIPLAAIGESFKNLKFALTSLGVNFIWIPILGFILSTIFLTDSPDLKIGYLMLLVTPCTDWYLIFTALARGNLPLSTSILPMNLIAQLLLLPVYLLAFSGLTGSIRAETLLSSVFWTLVAPLAGSLLVKWLFKEPGKARAAFDRIFANGVFLFLWLAILCMFASEARHLWGNLTQFKILFPPVVLFFLINFFVGRLVGRLAKFSHEDSVSLSMTTLARNSPVALAVAVVAFPTRPFIALALVVGPLIEIPVLFVVAQALLWIGRSKKG